MRMERKLVYLEFGTKNENLLVEGHYLEGKLDGENQGFYSNGNPKHYYYYNEGFRVGETKNYYPSGKLKENIVYNQQETNQRITTYFENGNTEWQKEIKFLAPTGTWKEHWGERKS